VDAPRSCPNPAGGVPAAPVAHPPARPVPPGLTAHTTTPSGALHRLVGSLPWTTQAPVTATGLPGETVDLPAPGERVPA